MAIYFDSPFGEIRGTIYGITASRARGGIKTLRAYSRPRVPGSRKEISRAIRGEITKEEISIKQANVIRNFNIINQLANKMRKLIYEAWEPSTRGTQLTGQTKFMKVNCTPLYHSIPKLNEFISKDNKPDLTKILVTQGRLELARIEKAKYDKEKGLIEVKWNSFYHNNANEEDEALITLIYWEPPNDPLDLTGKLKVMTKRECAKRKDGYAQIRLDELNELNEHYEPNELNHSLTLYLSFKSNMKYYGFSPSVATSLFP